MLTRRLIRQGVLWPGVGPGAAALLGYVLSLFVSIYHERPDRIVYIGRGAIAVQWAISRAVPVGGVAASPAPPAWHAESPGSRDWRFFPRCTDPDYTRAGAGPGLFVVPYWIPLLLGAVAGYVLLPAGAHASAKPRCPSCRFDLAGAPAVQVRRVHIQCPECGVISDRDEPMKAP